MSRSLRVEFEGALYHVMGRGVGRLRVYADDEDRRAFLDGVEASVKAGALVVHAFCLMPNHYHLLCGTPRGELSRWMRNINGTYSRRFNRRHRRVGHLWQGRYRAILVEDETYLCECSRYIHLNPNRSRLTRPAERYRWSSYRNYVGGPAVAGWVETAPVLDLFDGDPTAYRRYVEAGKGERPVTPFERAVAGIALGAAGFAHKVRALAQGSACPEQVPSLAALDRFALLEAGEVEAVVEQVFEGLHPRRLGVVKMYALQIHSRLRPVEVARRYSRTPAAVSLARSRVAARAGSD